MVRLEFVSAGRETHGAGVALDAAKHHRSLAHIAQQTVLQEV